MHDDQFKQLVIDQLSAIKADQTTMKGDIGEMKEDIAEIKVNQIEDRDDADRRHEETQDAIRSLSWQMSQVAMRQDQASTRR